MYSETGPEPWIMFYMSGFSKMYFIFKGLQLFNILKTNKVKDLCIDTDTASQHCFS